MLLNLCNANKLQCMLELKVLWNCSRKSKLSFYGFLVVSEVPELCGKLREACRKNSR